MGGSSSSSLQMTQLQHHLWLPNVMGRPPVREASPAHRHQPDRHVTRTADERRFLKSDFLKKPPSWAARDMSQAHYEKWVAGFVHKPIHVYSIGDAETQRRYLAGEAMPKGWKKRAVQRYLFNIV